MNQRGQSHLRPTVPTKHRKSNNQQQWGLAIVIITITVTVTVTVVVIVGRRG